MDINVNSKTWRRAATWALALTALYGCSEEVEQAKQAAEAASALAEAAGQAQKTGEAVEAAQAKAEAEAKAAVPEGATPEQAKQQIEMAKALAGMKAMQGSGGGPVVNWRQLAPHLPDALQGYKASSELDGATNSAGGMEVTEVKRRYKQGGRSMRVQITDTSMASMLRAPFAMAAMIKEDSTRGYKKGKSIGSHTAIVEWESKRKRSKATGLIGKRFVISVQVDDAQTEDEAEQVLKALPLDAIAALKANAE